ncbi:MAG: potassium/proton antiporter [Candidatus Nanopelagicales bacterium]
MLVSLASGLGAAIDPENAAQVDLVAAVVVLLAILGVRFATRLGLPGLLLYIFIGLVLGASSAGLHFTDAALATVLGYTALIVILAEGGLTTRPENVRPAMLPAALLATVGVAISIALVALPVHWLLGLDLRTATLIAAVMAPTDAAAVFTVARGLRLPSRMQTILEAESGLNDAPVVVLVVLLATASGEGPPGWLIPAVVIAEMLGGVVVGYLVGRLGRWLLPRLALPAAGLYPVAALALVVLSYGLAVQVHTSGFAAVYVSALVLGASALPHRRAVLGFVEGLAWAVQIGMFVMLGVLAVPARLPAAIPTALLVGLLLLVLARPGSVAVCLLPFRKPNWLTRKLRQPIIPVAWTVFIAVAGLRGAVPIIFATIPLAMGVPDGDLIFDTTLLLVILLTLVQAPTMPGLARRLGLVRPERAQELTVEVAPLDNMHASLLELDVPAGTALAGTYVTELPLPRGAVVSLVIRGNTSLVPDRHLRLRTGDRLLIVTTEDVRRQAERQLRSISRSGRLGDWAAEGRDPSADEDAGHPGAR